MKGNRLISKIIMVVIFLVGFGFILYPIVANEWNEICRRKVITVYDRQVEQSVEQGKISYENEKRKADEYNKALRFNITDDGFVSNNDNSVNNSDNDTDEDKGYDSIFKEKTGVSDGTALEFSVYPNHIELIDKDYVPPLTKSDGTQLLKQEQANALNGYLHMRFYQQSGTDNSPQHTATDENTKQVTQKYVAYAYTTAYPKDAYMGLYIKDLHFYARSYQKPKNGSKYARVTAITVVITIAKKDANGQSVTLCTQKAIIALPGEPVYIEKPGTWDGKASSES